MNINLYKKSFVLIVLMASMINTYCISDKVNDSPVEVTYNHNLNVSEPVAVAKTIEFFEPVINSLCNMINILEKPDFIIHIPEENRDKVLQSIDSMNNLIKSINFLLSSGHAKTAFFIDIAKKIHVMPEMLAYSWLLNRLCF